MICQPCREKLHSERPDLCPGGTYCDCKHQLPVTADQTEPAMNWHRQG